VLFIVVSHAFAVNKISNHRWYKRFSALTHFADTARLCSLTVASNAIAASTLNRFNDLVEILQARQKKRTCWYSLTAQTEGLLCSGGHGIVFHLHDNFVTVPRRKQ
jgi:hypothetical protein